MKTKASKVTQGNNSIIVIFDSCRYDTFMEARPKTIRKLGEVEQRWSYASWTAPSHYNLLMGLLPHSSPKQVFASEYYKQDFLRFNERLGSEGISFRSLVPKLYFPTFLQSMGYRTNAMVSLPVLNPRPILNNGFDTFRLMDKHNDMRAMIKDMTFPEDKPSFYLLNVGETHYPYALPDEPPSTWPRISGVHGVFRTLDDQPGPEPESEPAFFDGDVLAELRARQVRAVSYLDGVFARLFSN